MILLYSVNQLYSSKLAAELCTAWCWTINMRAYDA